MTKKAKPPLETANDFARFMEREMDKASWMRSGRWEVWRGWVSWMLRVLQGDAEGMAALEARSPEAVEAWKAWRDALVATFRVNPYQDALGSAYMAIGHGNKYMGQFFTPMPVASLMARITLDDTPRTKEGRLLLGCEPTCGSGVMILAAAHARHETGLPPVVWQAMDLDRHCCEMTAIQLFLADIPALVLCCDSLRFGMAEEDTAEVVAPRLWQPGDAGAPVLVPRLTEAGARLALDQVREHAETMLTAQMQAFAPAG